MLSEAIIQLGINSAEMPANHYCPSFFVRIIMALSSVSISCFRCFDFLPLLDVHIQA